MITPPKNYNKMEILAADQAHHLHPFTDHHQLHQDQNTRAITRADGIYIYDIDGNKIIDGMAGLWCVNVGYGRKSLAETAYAQMLELPYYNTFFKTTTPPVARLAAKVASLLPDHINHVFFGNSGSDANDSALRLVRHYWALAGKPNKRHIISRVNAYHGSTLAGAALGGMKPMHRQAGAEISDIHHIMQPYWYGMNDPDLDLYEFGIKAAAALEDKIIALGADRVAAFHAEPIQGAGGVIIPPPNYWHEIQRICKQYDVLIVADEVICGFGRTGNYFGHQSLDFSPDMVLMAKGLSSGYMPISAVGVGQRIHQTLYDQGGEFYHGYTYSGHPVAAAVALKNLEIIENEKLVEKVRTETGPYLASKLHSLLDHPLVGEVRSMGLIGAFELTKDKKTHARFDDQGGAGTVFRDHIFKLGGILRACGDTIVISPPLTITNQQIDELMALAHKALDLTQQSLKQNG